MYRYTASARDRALMLLPVGLVLTALGAFFLFFWWTLVFGVLGLMVGLIGVLALGLSAAWLVGGGRWEITIDDQRIDWRAPVVSEGSFRYALDELDCVRKRTRQKRRHDGTVKAKVDYQLVTVDGTTRTLTNQSGVDVETVVQVLVDRGVRFEEETVRKGEQPEETT